MGTRKSDSIGIEKRASILAGFWTIVSRVEGLERAKLSVACNRYRYRRVCGGRTVSCFPPAMALVRIFIDTRTFPISRK
jgi:hypothetical protein